MGSIIEATVVNSFTELSNVNHNVVIVTKTGEVIKPNSYGGGFTVWFNYVFTADDSVAFTVRNMDIVSYVVGDNENKDLKAEISVDVFEQLPASLQSLYSPNEVETVGVEVTDREVVITNLNEVAESSPNLLVYTSNDVLGKISDCNFVGVNKQAMARGQRYSYEDSKNHIEVVFFKEPYTGGSRKILDKKRNGAPYADRRGRNVPDYPDVVDTITIPVSKVPVLSAGSQKEMDGKLMDYFNFITMSHLLED